MFLPSYESGNEAEKGKATPGFFRIWVLLLCLLGGGGGIVAHGEALRLPGEDAGVSSETFFQDKFACVRWVEKKAPDTKCLECHASILNEEDLAARAREGATSVVTVVHTQHMRSGKVNFSCVTCHQSVDPYQTSSAGVRNQVSANMCFKCHFPHGQE